VYDREHRFFEEDFAALQQAAYWTIAVPQALGGLGLSPAEVAREQRRLVCARMPPLWPRTCISCGPRLLVR
jgi:alkylation response protein AidB-like acyl-CoA dehydrogenase